MDTPLISVVIPVYKVEQYIHRSVDSILCQTYKNLEIILIDDGSPDICGIICDEYVKQDGRVVVIHKQNGGLSSARNAGIQAAGGKYICFVDSDDWVEPIYVEAMVYAMENNEADLVACGIHRTEKLESRINAIDETFVQNKYKAVLQDDSIAGYAWNKLFSLDVIRRHGLYFDENIFNGEDLPFVVSYLKYCTKIMFLKQELYHYFIRPGSITTNIIFSDRYTTIIYARECVMKMFEAEANQECLDIERHAYLIHLIKLYYLAKDTSKSKKEWRNEFKGKIKKQLPAIMRSQYISAKNKAQLILMWYGRFIVGSIYRKR